MKNKSTKSTFSNILFLMFPVLIMSLAMAIETAEAKSLYVLTDIELDPQPLQAYDIGPDGTLTFQTEHSVPRIELGGVGIAADADNGYLFITYEDSSEIFIVDATTLENIGSVMTEDAVNLAGIVYDHKKELLYCVDRNESWLYVYRWDAVNIKLEEVPDSPFNLRRATAYGIALNEIDNILYVANGTNEIYAYDTDTSNWPLMRTIRVSRVAVSVAVDVKNGYLYSGAGYLDNHYLTQYHLATNTEKEVLIEPDAGVMGLGVDPESGVVYMSTGTDQWPGGDNLLIYNASLLQIGKIPSIGSKPTGLVVPGKNIGYNPLNLHKEATEGVFGTNEFDEMQSVGAGGLITYTISFDNIFTDTDVTDVIVVDTLPDEVSFVSTSGEAFGEYNPVTHTCTWLYPTLSQGTSVSVDLTVEVNENIEPGTSFTNFVSINSNQTPQTTTGYKVYTSRSPLFIKKSVSGVLSGETKTVEPGEEITYRIHFNNYDNDFRATGITIVDFLPQELSFVSADYDQSLGRYDPKEHIYTWRHPALEPGTATQVKLVARVNPDVIPGTTITNFAVIDSDQTSESSSNVDVIVAGDGPVNRFNLTKNVVGNFEKVGTGEEVSYCICFDGNDISQPVTNVSVVDFLPQNLSFVKADGDGIIGQYDEKAHTYTWSYPFISQGEVVKLEITAKVNEEAPSGQILSNLATISSDATPPVTASVDILVDEGGRKVESLEIIPSTIRRDGTLSGIMAVLEFSKGTVKNDIADEPLVLFPGNIKANQQLVIETDGITKIVAVFDKTEVLDAIPVYGNVDVEIVGKFTTGQSFYGQTTITISRFALN
jgi:uncharacterized repeat protein (TIGR01451 family)